MAAIGDRASVLEVDMKKVSGRKSPAGIKFPEMARKTPVENDWAFFPLPSGEVRARNEALCRAYAEMNEKDLLEISGCWRMMAEEFTQTTKQTGHYHGHIVHDDQVERITKLLETAMSGRAVDGVNRLGRCLRRPDNGHLHWALAALDELDAKLRAEACGRVRTAEVNHSSHRTLRPATRANSAMAKGLVFISYCHDNVDQVREIRNELIAAGETVWWDGDILPGKDWRHEIRKAMKRSYAVVLCLSQELAERIESGVFPEVFDVIGLYRKQTPGSIFLIPIRLSECEIPDIEIDSTRTLDNLHFADFFPAKRRVKGLQQLLSALKDSPNHP
jgi:hypothetical protein